MYVALPSEVHSYPPFQLCKDRLQVYIQHDPLICDLRSAAIKIRHWKKLKQLLALKCEPENITLGAVWDTNPFENKKIYQEIITLAQGEQALGILNI